MHQLERLTGQASLCTFSVRSSHLFCAFMLYKLIQISKGQAEALPRQEELFRGPSPAPKGSDLQAAVRELGCSKRYPAPELFTLPLSPTPPPYSLPPPSRHRGSRTSQMGQGLSSETVLWKEVGERTREACLRAAKLKSEAAAEEAAGIPPGCGSKQVLYQAALQHSRQLTAEYVAIGNRLSERCQSRLLLFGLRCADKPVVLRKSGRQPCLQRPQAAPKWLVRSSLVPSQAQPCRVCCRPCSCQRPGATPPTDAKA